MKLLSLVLAAVALAPAALAQPAFSKQFSPNTIGPGSTTTLTYTIDASSSGVPVTVLAFTETLAAGLTVASPARASTTCGDRATLSATSGSGVVSLTGGTVGAGGQCTVTVNVIGGAVGSFTSTSGDLTSSAGNSGSASATLTVSADRPGFTKAFSPSTVGFQGRSRLTFTVDNSANTNAVSTLSFADDFPVNMVIADPANPTTTCQNESPQNFPVQITADPGSNQLTFFVNGFNSPGFRALPAGATCTVSVDVVGNAVGTLGNVSGDLLADNQSAGKASAVLTVAAGGLVLTKAFTDDPTPPGGTVDVLYTLRNTSRTSAVTNVSFTDDFDAALSGLAATGLPRSGVCGSGSQLSGTGVLALSGATLPAEGACSFSVAVQVPAGAAQGSYASSTSGVTGDAGTRAVTGLPASDDLVVAAVPTLAQTLTPNPVSPGATVTLQSTLTNTSTTAGATGIAFEQPLPLAGSSTITLPADGFCGPGSTASLLTENTPTGPVTTGAQISGAELAAGASCVFDIVVALPEAAPGGTYTSTTSRITATVDGVAVSGAPVSTDLVVIQAPRLTAAFLSGVATPGAATPLRFTLAYGGEVSEDATGIAFTADLDAALAGLAASGLPVAACEGMLSSADGGSTLDYSGGTLAPGETCAFDVPVTVPAGAAAGGVTVTTSSVTAQVGTTAVTSAPASADLLVSPVRFSKTFVNAPVDAGGSVTLAFTIENTSATDAVTSLSFTDNVNAVLSGLASTSGTQGDVCGSGSSLSGTTFLILTNGSLAAGASCTFSAALGVPVGAADGIYTNVTSQLTGAVGSGGSQVLAEPATSTLVVGDVEPIVATVTSGPTEGWRMLAAPVAGVTVGDLAGLNLVSGVPGDAQCDAAIANLFTGYRGGSDTAGNIGSYVKPSAYTDELEPGRGLFWYFYDDPADAGPCGDGATTSSVQPLPIVISATGAPSTGDVTTTFTAAERATNEDTFYLAGNPFDEAIDLDGTASGLTSITAGDAAGSVAFQNTVHIWDPGAGGYVTRTAQPDGGTSASDDVAVWQGMWLERSAAAPPTYPLTLIYAAGARTGVDGTFVGKTESTGVLRTLRFEIAGTIAEQSVFDGAASLLFADGATGEWDAYDASKLGGFATPSALLAVVGQDREGALVPKAAESQALDVAGSVTVPLVFRASGAGTFELSWPEMNAIPETWALTLADSETGEVVDLRAASAYAFTADASVGWTERFSVTASAPFVGTEDDLVDGYAVGPAYPNPARASATLSVRVADAQTVRAEVFNMLGQRVATVFDGALAPGAAAQLSVDTAPLAAGRYLIRVVGETFVETRPLTVVR